MRGNYFQNERRYIFLVMAITFAVRINNNLILTGIPLIAKYYLFLNDADIGALSALAVGSTAIMSAFINSRLSYSKRRILFIFSIILYTVIEPLFYFSNFYNIWILTAISGFFFGTIIPNIISSTGTIENRKLRERTLTLYTLSLSSSLIVGPLLESFILIHFNLRQMFLFFVPFGIIAIILSTKIRFPEDSKTKKTRHIDIFKNRGFMLSIFNNISYDTPFALILTFGGIFARTEFNASFSFIEFLLAGFFGFSFLSRAYLAFRPSRRLYINTIMSVSITLAGLIMIFLSRNLIMYFIIISLLGIPHGITYPTSLTALSRSFSSEQISIANTYFYAVMMVVAVAVPSISGLMAYSIGLRFTFLLFVFPIFFLFILILYYYHRNPEINQ